MHSLFFTILFPFFVIRLEEFCSKLPFTISCPLRVVLILTLEQSRNSCTYSYVYNVNMIMSSLSTMLSPFDYCFPRFSHFPTPSRLFCPIHFCYRRYMMNRHPNCITFGGYNGIQIQNRVSAIAIENYAK